jgi:hypothetical protein
MVVHDQVACDEPPPLQSGVVGWNANIESKNKPSESIFEAPVVKWNKSMRLDDLQAAVKEQVALIKNLKKAGADSSKVSAAKNKLREMKKVQDDLKRNSKAGLFPGGDKYGKGKKTPEYIDGKKVEAEASTSSSAPKQVSTSSKQDQPTKTTVQEETATESDSAESKFKGYKTLADGTKTTYFNRQLSQKDAELIGSIAPKKIESAVQAKPAAAKAGESQWNTAGTWEEKNKTIWATDRLREVLICSQSVGIVADDKIEFTDVKKIEGDAQICIVRGKKRYIYDFNITLAWDCYIADKVYQGKLVLADAASDCDGKYECEIQWGKTRPEAEQKKQVTKSLEALVTGAITSFASEFQAM